MSIRQGVGNCVYVSITWHRYAGNANLVNAPRQSYKDGLFLKTMTIQGGGKGAFNHMDGILIKKPLRLYCRRGF